MNRHLKSFQSGNENFAINSYGRKKNGLGRNGGVDEWGEGSKAKEFMNKMFTFIACPIISFERTCTQADSLGLQETESVCVHVSHLYCEEALPG